MKLPILDWSLAIWRSANVICGVLVVAVWFAGNAHIEHLEETSPRAPDPATGEIVPMHWKSVVVYMTPQNAAFDRWFSAVGFAACLGLLAIAFWRTRKNGRPN